MCLTDSCQSANAESLFHSSPGWPHQLVRQCVCVVRMEGGGQMNGGGVCVSVMIPGLCVKTVVTVRCC